MHADGVETDAGLVRRLLSAQFPQWSGLRVERVPSFGTDNALYRLGDDMVVRLPRIDWAASDIDKDARWLDQLRPLVPVAIPQQLATGTPGLGFPWRWGIYRWLEGANPVVGAIDRPEELARDVGRFVAALRRVRLNDTRTGSRAGPLAARDSEGPQAVPDVAGELGAAAGTTARESGPRAPAWGRAARWALREPLRGNPLGRAGLRGGGDE